MDSGKKPMSKGLNHALAEGVEAGLHLVYQVSEEIRTVNYSNVDSLQIRDGISSLRSLLCYGYTDVITDGF